MRTPATIEKHPLHPLLVALPIGLFIFSLISDIIFFAGWGPQDWAKVAFYTLGGGIVTAIIAAIPGFIDWYSLEDKTLQNKATTHMITMLISLAIFIADFFVRYTTSLENTIGLVLSIIGVLGISFGGWIGAEMVHRFGVGVEDNALSTRRVH